MHFVLALLIGVLFACGLHLAQRRDLFTVALGIGLMGSAINVLILVLGRLHGTAPALATDTGAVTDTGNPLPQAFVLTAIVIGFAFVAFLLALAKRLDTEQTPQERPNQQ